MVGDTFICPQCRKEFVKEHPVQKYCSKKCYNKYRKENGKCAPWPELTFNCAWCGKVVVTGGTDRRSRFCSYECERKYWRHPSYDYESYSQAFHTLGEMESYEKRTNRDWSGS